MKLPVRLPQFGESAAEATVVAWLVQPGARVAAEQELVEVQTEKSLLTVSAPAAGAMGGHMVEPGRQLKVGDELTWIEVANGAAPAQAAPVTAPAATAPAPAAGAGRERKPRAAVRGASGDSTYISPRVRARLEEYGLKLSDLAMIPGRGAGGRVTAQDIESYAAQGTPMSQVRQAVANGMSRSWTRPLATVAMPLRLDRLLEHRRGIAGKPTLTVYAMKALAMALSEGSPLRSRLVLSNRLVTPAHVDLAVAVEVDDGVLTPVVRKVETLPLADLTARVDEVIAKAREGRVADAGDAVGAVSNYGVFGITWATPIPLPGQCVILGLGAPRPAPEWNPATRTWDRVREAELTLTFDHRIADGGAAGRLLARIVALLLAPEKVDQGAATPAS